MKIAQVITLYLPDFVGGATLACAALARGLAARGHDVHVFCGRPHGDAEPYGESTWEVDGIPVVGINAAAGYDALAERSYRHPETGVAFARFLDQTRPDVVHFHSIQALGAELLAIAAERRVPVVVTMHDWWWWCARLFLVDQHDFVCPPRVDSTRCHCAPGFDLVARRAHLAAMLTHADRVLTPSRFLADAAIANGVAAERVAVSANGVARAGVRPLRRPGPIRFGYFGGPDHRMKGLPTLLAAADRAGCGGFELVLHVGTAATRHGLTRQLVDRVGLTVPIPVGIDDRVRLAEPFAPDELPRVLGALDCLVVPSLMRESYSLVTREALAAGVPVIASDSGGPQEVIAAERNGLVFATGDADDLARCLRRFVLEPGLADRLADGAAATPLPTLADQLDGLEQVYAEITAGRAAAPAPAARALGPVLFLAGCDGAPFRYRVTHLRDALATQGIASRALWWSDPDVPAAIAAADTIVVYRVPMSPWLEECLRYARALGKPLVFACDDLLFDATATPHDALAGLSDGERTWWLAATGRFAAALASCDAFLGSTEPLAVAAARLGVPGFVARNGLGERALAVVERLRKTVVAPPDQPVVLTYLSGTTMHELDFAAAAPALARVLATRPAVRLKIGGHLLPHPALAPFASRIERLPFLPWPDMFEALATSAVQLAPLRLGDAFTDAKSEVKWLEAGALGVPTIASPTDAFRRVVRHGENGLLATTPDEWDAMLLALVDDPALRCRLGNRARDDVFLRATPEAQAEALVTALVAARAAGRRAPTPLPLSVPDPARFAGEVGRHALEPDGLVPGVAVEARDTPSGLLVAGRSVGQVLRPRGRGLCRIDVRVGANGGRAGADEQRRDQRLVLRVARSLADRAAPIRSIEIDAATLADDAWVSATFPPIAEDEADLYVWIEALGAPATPLTLWTYCRGHGDTPPAGLHLDHVPASGSLSFRTFHTTADDQ